MSSMSTIITPANLKLFYQTFSIKRKERFEIILEPLQAITQLALLSFCPNGTKIHIQNNILHIQLPGYSQGFVRWCQNDTKDDLFYLFYVCKRFTKFYQHLKTIKTKNEQPLYDLLIYLAKKGIHNLTMTYGNIDKIALLHTLEMYKLLLDNPSQFTLESEQSKEHIDNIFSKINEIYTKEEYYIIYNTLLLIQKQPDTLSQYMNGLNIILKPTNDKIHSWIHNNIVF